jgi:ribosome-associated protein
VLDALRVTDQVVIPAADLSWSAVRSSGPGGQNVNKVASKVVLVLELASTRALPAAAKARLRALAGWRVDALGRLHVSSQLTRDQGRNLEDARDKLRELCARALVAPKPRKPTKPTRGSKRRRVEDKRRRSGDKALRRRIGADD